AGWLGTRHTRPKQTARPHPGRPGESARGGRPKKETRRNQTPAAPAMQIEPPSLFLFNGLGGFSSDAKEYVVVLDGDDETPAPWVNIISNPSFGTIVTASGSSFTWAENSRENRLTPFWNDPVT